MIQFSTDDLRTPESLERVLRQFESSIKPAAAAPRVPTAGELLNQLLPLLRDELQAPGRTPLNLTALLPSQGQGVILEDTHANRLTLYPPGNYSVGTVFYETDRTYTYAIVNVSGSLVWQYLAGIYYTTFANRPTDLSTYDSGALYVPTEHLHFCRWTGAAWVILDPDAGTFIDSAATLTTGWQLCDGTVTSFLVVSGAGLAQSVFTTPDEVTAPSGVYHKSIAAYTGVITASTAGTITGSTANAATGITIVDHPSHTHDDASSLGTPDLFAPDVTATGVAGRTGGPDATLTHPVTDPQHLHAAGTLAVDATGEPRNMGVLRYFRR